MMDTFFTIKTGLSCQFQVQALLLITSMAISPSLSLIPEKNMMSTVAVTSAFFESCTAVKWLFQVYKMLSHGLFF